MEVLKRHIGDEVSLQNRKPGAVGDRTLISGFDASAQLARTVSQLESKSLAVLPPDHCGGQAEIGRAHV